MKTITPQTINFYAKDKDGKNFITRNGNTYMRARITTATDTIYVNIFTPEQKELLKVGQAIELEETQNGQYLNYSFPRKKSPQDIKIDELEMRMDELEARMVAYEMTKEIKNLKYDAEMVANDKKFNPEYENMGEDREELPF